MDKGFIDALFTFFIALTVPLIIGVTVGILTGNILIMLCITFSLLLYTLIGGKQKNGELENAIGGIWGHMTPWVIPAGISWWFPWPIGQALQKTHIGVITIDRTQDTPIGNNTGILQKVITKDGAQFEISYSLSFTITQLLHWVAIPESDRIKIVNGIIDQHIRWFALSFNAEDAYDTDKKPISMGIMSQKQNFLEYLLGTKELSSFEHPTPIPSILAVELEKIGIEIVGVRIYDIKPPSSLIQAREALIKKDAQTAEEEKNINALLAQVERLQTLGISPTDALNAALVTRGDTTGVNITGGVVGDFTTAAVVNNKTNNN